MRQKIVLRQQAVPIGTSFATWYEGISRKKLHKSNQDTNHWSAKRRTKKKKVRFTLANTPTQGKARKIKKKYRKIQRAQTGHGIVSDLPKLGISVGSKAINSVLG